MSMIVDKTPPELHRPSRPGEPAWEIATLFPTQGAWSEEAYLALPSNRLLELNDRCLEVLPMPTYFHELIVEFLYDLLRAFVRQHSQGKVMRAPLPIRLWEGQMREPDVFFLRHERLNELALAGNRGQPDGADLVMEVVSPGPQNRERDLEVKRKEYARAGIAEYWIVDSERRTITVLTLEDAEYRVAGEFDDTQSANSILFPLFSVSVHAAFQAGEASGE
jgi:Uma2 family endonuclease